MKHTSHSDKPCPIAQTLGIIGDNWTLLILRNCFMRTTRFDDFQQQLGITRHVLSDRLKKLVEHGILKKVPYGESGKRFEYRLTRKGVSLSPVLMTLASWGNDWLFDEGEAPVEYVHTACGQKMKPIQMCSSCGEAVETNEVKMVLGDALSESIKGESAEDLNTLLGFSLSED